MYENIDLMPYFKQAREYVVKTRMKFEYAWKIIEEFSYSNKIPLSGDFAAAIIQQREYTPELITYILIVHDCNKTARILGDLIKAGAETCTDTYCARVEVRAEVPDREIAVFLDGFKVARVCVSNVIADIREFCGYFSNRVLCAYNIVLIEQLRGLANIKNIKGSSMLTGVDYGNIKGVLGAMEVLGAMAAGDRHMVSSADVMNCPGDLLTLKQVFIYFYNGVVYYTGSKLGGSATSATSAGTNATIICGDFQLECSEKRIMNLLYIHYNFTDFELVPVKRGIAGPFLQFRVALMNKHPIDFYSLIMQMSATELYPLCGYVGVYKPDDVAKRYYRKDYGRIESYFPGK